eukprot:scaffold101599_cov35-Prasinocladus_malaysianus.AAC.2
MSGISGTKTSMRIRELYPEAHIMPIIITSGMDSEEIRSSSDYLASGVNDVISKPINKQTLTNTIACQLKLVKLQRGNYLLRSILPDSIIARLTAGQK